MSDQSYFTMLNSINVNDKTEKKNGLTYLSWAWAWGEFKKVCPDATYEVVKFEGKPYFYDPQTGYMVYTTVTVGNLTHEMWLPVMDGANKAMKAEPYVYTAKQYDKTERCYKEVEKTCNAATMFDINKTIMRCLVKNLAMFGLGLYIYAGEDLPEEQEEADREKTKNATSKSVIPGYPPRDKMLSVVKEKYPIGDENTTKMLEHYGIKSVDELNDFQLSQVWKVCENR